MVAQGPRNSRPRGVLTMNLGVISIVVAYTVRMATRLDGMKVFRDT